ncbi:MAG: hypothetical protein AAF367_13185 [Pseudomonadota bacterium]
MKLKSSQVRLLLVGVPHRLSLAAFIVIGLWLAFMWATGAPGPR